MIQAKRASYLLLVLLFLLPSILAAQLRVEGEFRPRSEFRNGYRLVRTPTTEPAFFTSQRTRVAVSYQSENYKMKLSGQDVRVWGEVVQLQDNSNVNIHEAWAQLYLSDQLQVRLGRQELIYGNQRLLGSVNWTQQARSHDAAVLSYSDSESDLSIDIGGAYNQEAEKLLENTYTLDNYKMLSYLWVDKQVQSLDLSAMFLTDGFQVQPNATNFRYTYGGSLNYEKEGIVLTGSAFVQSGDDDTRRDISAHMLAGQVSYDLSGITISAGYDYLSGGSAADANPMAHTFNTLYATNHKFYGNMDYFLNVPADTKGGGLQDLHIASDVALTGNSSLGFTYHYFTLANRIEQPGNSSETIEPYLGSEIDMSYSYEITPEMTFKLGYSALFSSSFLGAVQSRNEKAIQHWAWTMLQVSPTIFTSD